MLQQDAARYWDLSTMDVVLYDESGAIWPSDAYVALEMQQQPTARIAMRVKPVAATIEEEVRSREIARDCVRRRGHLRDRARFHAELTGGDVRQRGRDRI